MKNYKAYVNAKAELDLISLRIQSLEAKEIQLNKEKESLAELKSNLNNILNLIEIKLKELKGIEKELFNEVIVKGTNITREVDKVAITYDVDVSTIWKNYYPKIKEDIKNLENLMKSSEILV